MKRSKPQKDIVNELFSEVIRSTGYCEARDYYAVKIPACGGPLQPAHIFTRERNSTFADTRNALCLCQNMHSYFHRYPKEFRRFIATTWAEQCYDQVERKSWDTRQGKTVDWEERIKFLTAILNGEVTLAEARKMEDNYGQTATDARL